MVPTKGFDNQRKRVRFNAAKWTLFTGSKGSTGDIYRRGPTCVIVDYLPSRFLLANLSHKEPYAASFYIICVDADMPIGIGY